MTILQFHRPQASHTSRLVNLPLTVPVGSVRGLFPELIGVGGVAQVTCQALQDNSDRQADVSPVRIIVHGRRTAIRVGRSVGAQVKRPFSRFSLLSSFVLHVLNSVMEQIRNVRKSIGKIQHV